MLAKVEKNHKTIQELMGHSDFNTTMKHYIHSTSEDKSNAVNKLPTIQTVHPKQAKTGTCDIPENNSTLNSTQNPVKIHENIVKFRKRPDSVRKEKENVSSRYNKSLREKNGMRVLGLEPKTYGLKERYNTP